MGTVAKRSDLAPRLSLIGGVLTGAHAVGTFIRGGTAVGASFSGGGMVSAIGEGVVAGVKGFGTGMLAGVAAGLIYYDLNELAACMGV
jgi:hypothetical protein